MTTDAVEAIGPYRVIGRLGSGGMGDVLLGRSPGGRQVAIKVVHRHLARDNEFRARFAREIQAARAVGGFYTAAVVDADWEAPQPWFATEYIAGLSLKQLVTDFGPLPESSVEELAAGIVEALAAIHAAGVTHRDLTPGNVLLTESGPRVIDFGIAKLVAETQQVTATGALIGTPGYMSPEHVLGGDVGPAGDVFSLGSVLTLAATGHGPFEDKTTAMVLSRVAYSAPNLTGLREGRLYRIILACLDKDAEARPGTAALLEALRDHRAGPSNHWLPQPMMQALATPPPVEPVGRERKTSRRAILTAAAVGVTALAGAAVATKLIADRSDVKEAAAERKPGGTLLWKADIGTFVDKTYSPEPPAVDGTSVYAGSIDGSVYAVDIATGAIRWKGVMQQQLSHGPVYADGRVFATNSARGIFAFDAATGAELWENSEISSAIAASGGLVFGSVSSTRENGIVAFDVATGARRWTALADAKVDVVPIYAADGAVVTVTGAHEVCLLDAATGAVRWQMSDPKDEIYGLSTPVISGGAVYVSSSNVFRALDVATGAEKWRFRFGGSSTVVRGDTVFVQGDSRAYAFDAADGTVRWLYRTDDTLSRTLAVGEDSVYCIAAKQVLALDIASGEQRWAYGTPDTLGAVTFGSGAIYVGGNDRNLYAISA
ncbi:PQQ-binding-like beta-propeller repeat protein [Nocardia huaxiensis]|uniref:PQQ-binding-like beta-propeller repeat protein n=1 Tax=Nocardia huaxiensis TaxID=2755382 RepID=A0A7D6YZC2_9NOCA|nr:serine/threonine-protein kinase [Nocardia huaxiensis]QLY28166.1 PQQ-binding-like beta-propeller repeat protein [Nocardia huaxiensis]UFS98388.1 PQQ-binding-like beta-propeller repeat protein [Nocardia huaxiensis]